MNVFMAVVFIKSSKEITPSAGDILRQIDFFDISKDDTRARSYEPHLVRVAPHDMQFLAGEEEGPFVVFSLRVDPTSRNGKLYGSCLIEERDRAELNRGPTIDLRLSSEYEN
jgi:hypothetical protein